MKHTQEELRTWQNYPLQLKKSLTAARIRELASQYEFYVSFSGGKDSEVAVDLTAKVLKELGCSKMYVLNIRTGLEYMSVMNFCKPFCDYISQKYNIEVVYESRLPKTSYYDVLRKDGYPVISKEVSLCIREARKGIQNGDGTYQYRLDKLDGVYKNKDGTLSSYNMSQYKFLLDAPFRISELCCNKTKKEPAIIYEKETGRIPLIATTAEESRLRKTTWLRHGCNAFDLKRPKSAPFSFWKEQDMLHYIKEENLPIAEAYGEIVPENTSGIEGQISLFETCPSFVNSYSGCNLCTTGCARTGCLYCLFGITNDLLRIIRLQEQEPKRADYVLRGGEFDSDGMWVPTKEGLGFWFILDWFAKNNIAIPYNNAEKYRRIGEKYEI